MKYLNVQSFVKKELIILLVYSAVLLLSEILYRQVMGITALYRTYEAYIILFVVVSLFYFAKTKLFRFLIVLFFASSTIINNIHYEVYQNWINGVNYFLMFKEAGEVTHAGLSMLDKIAPAVIWGSIDCLIFYSISFFRQRSSSFVDGFFALLMIYIFIRSFFTLQELGINSTPGYSRIKSNFFSFGYFIGRVLPYELFNLSDIPVYKHDEPQVIAKPKVKNIILIMGESASAKHFGALGYPRNTTPFLSKLISEEKSTLLKPTYAAGFMTAISLPTFFNAIPKPNGMEQIMTGKTNIFNLAKKQNYKTYFYSAQAENQMMIISIMGKTWIDDLRFPSQMGYSIKKSINDHLILPLFYEINLDDGNNLVVLHQRGSHTPYAELLSEDEKFFKENTPLDNYDSTIYNTDSLINKVYSYLKSRGKNDWLLIYTSDHGQYVSNAVYNQGTNQESNYIVPTMIYSPIESLQEVKEKLSACSTLFHQQVSTYIINIMGYDMPISDCKKGITNSLILTGDAGYLEIDEERKTQLFFYPKNKE